MAGVGTRREARERALGLLYEADAKGADVRDVIAALPLPPDPFAADVASGVADHLEEIDEHLRRWSKGWAIERMPVIDRMLLRMGVYELLHRPDVPASAIISEAVELAGTYSTDDSSRFVNGVLGSVADDVRGHA